MRLCLRIRWICIFLILPSLFSGYSTAAAKMGSSEVFQKGLTIYEIDRELERLVEQDEKLEQEIAATDNKIEQKQKDIKITRERAKKVVKAYYMGGQTSLWQAVLEADSFQNAFIRYRYIRQIFKRQDKILSDYAVDVRELTNTSKNQQKAKLKLEETRQRYLAQKKELLAKQQELELLLKNSGMQKELEEQIGQLNKKWETEGLPLFKTYFKELARTMKDLPELVTQDRSKHLKLNGFSTQFELTDSDLNNFLRSKNNLFSHLTFRFKENQVVAEGKDKDVQMTIKGTYKLEEDSGEQVIAFHLEDLVFNGYSLPLSTRRTLEEDFDLGFYPKLMVSFIKVSDVKVSDGKLNLNFKFSL
ncbi:hypothetical protein B7C51_03825 [Paenibacillus larvae subsp. pulvifaciens]|uniref:Membrane-bound metallopeptidase n=1 Tax=Paenibacillus larvae subsp. pulvifaciens TaxID=1477 RepID=A0A1V0UQ76_9BACL|nr:hypothetical protein [Paenibacillus larvae]ARF67122.1 hypothetical protein B7C51_03825 [Paenibacillus larvae subsp. pulvifaciens]